MAPVAPAVQLSRGSLAHVLRWIGGRCEGSWLSRIAVGLIVVILGGIGVMWLLGYRAFFIETPSMARTAPVGSLVIVHPEGSYQVGEIVSFRQAGKVYTHRLIDMKDGVFFTKGDLNGSADAWQLREQDIIGQAVTIIPAAGWLWRALPWLILGWLLVYGATTLKAIPPPWVRPLRFVGAAGVLAMVHMWLHPWVNMVMLGYTEAPGGKGIMFHVVNGGLFPLKVEGQRIVTGQDAVVQVTTQDANGLYHLVPQTSLGLGWTAVLATLCLTPLLLAVLIKSSPVKQSQHAGPAHRSRIFPGKASGIIRSFWSVAMVIVVLAMVWGIFLSSGLTQIDVGYAK